MGNQRRSPERRGALQGDLLCAEEERCAPRFLPRPCLSNALTFWPTLSPTDSPESDGTLAWNKTILVVVEAIAGDRQGLGYTYVDLATARLIQDKLAAIVVGRDAMAAPGAWAALVHEVRNLAKAAAGMAQERQIPQFAPQTFKAWVRRQALRNTDKPLVILWADTFNNYFHLQTAKAAIAKNTARRSCEQPSLLGRCSLAAPSHGFSKIGGPHENATRPRAAG